MIESLLKHKIQSLFGVAGVLFILLSMFSIQDITKLQVTFIEPVRRWPLLAGIVFVLLSLIWHTAPYLTSPFQWTAMTRVRACSQGFQTNIERASIEVCFGTIQQFADMNPGALVALPANDLFDDDCIHDTRSALGAFVNHMFPNQVHEVCRLLRAKFKTLAVLKNPDNAAGSPRYDIGTTVYFKDPLSKTAKIAFVATTNVMGDQGIRCEAPNIFKAVDGLHRLMNIERLDTVLLPVIGSGHGELRPSTSLICMLIAFADRLRQPSGGHIKQVRIVVYQKESRAKPAIPPWQVRRLLAFVQQCCRSQG